MKKLTFLVLIMSLMALTKGLAHEGHDHDAPTTIKPVKGGLVKALDEARIELVAKGNEFKIYFFDQEMKPLKLEQFKVMAAAEIPRKKIKESIALTAVDSALTGHFDARGSHRYTLKLKVTDLSLKRDYDLSFTLEPNR